MQSTKRCERGSFLTELVVAFPVLFFLLVGTIDLSIGMLTYLRVARVAYETARYGTSLPGLPASMDSAKALCDQSQTFDAQTMQVVTRAQKLMVETPLYFSDIKNVKYYVSHDPASRQVNVCLEVEWKSLLAQSGSGFAPFGNVIRVSATAPYLFPS